MPSSLLTIAVWASACMLDSQRLPKLRASTSLRQSSVFLSLSRSVKSRFGSAVTAVTLLLVPRHLNFVPFACILSPTLRITLNNTKLYVNSNRHGERFTMAMFCGTPGERTETMPAALIELRALSRLCNYRLKNASLPGYCA